MENYGHRLRPLRPFCTIPFTALSKLGELRKWPDNHAIARNFGC